MNDEKSLKIKVGSIKDVETTWFIDYFIDLLYIMNRHAVKCINTGMEILTSY